MVHQFQVPECTLATLTRQRATQLHNQGDIWICGDPMSLDTNTPLYTAKTYAYAYHPTKYSDMLIAAKWIKNAPPGTIETRLPDTGRIQREQVKKDPMQTNMVVQYLF